MDDSTNIKDIDISGLTIIQEVDHWLGAVRKAIANMQGQLDSVTLADTVRLADLSESDRKWVAKVRGAKRHALVAEQQLLDRRDALVRGCEETAQDLIDTLQAADCSESDKPKITFTVEAGRAQRWLRDLRALIRR